MFLYVIQDGMIILPLLGICDASISILGCCRMVSLVSKADAFNVEFCHCVNIISCQRNWRTLYVEVILDVAVIGVLARTSQENENIRLQYLYLLRDDMEVFFLRVSSSLFLKTSWKHPC